MSELEAMVATPVELRGTIITGSGRQGAAVRDRLEGMTMTMIDWYIEGPSFGNCNCDWSCPCQFESLPTHGNCQGFEVVRIDKGHFGDTRLDGLRTALFYAWPGAIFEGHGEMQAVIDERADEAQREALLSILHGKHTNEAATHWWVFHAMSDTVHEPLFKPIDFEVDIEGRSASVSIPGLVRSHGSPIVSPATGDVHRVRLDMPEGIEFSVAEVGNASTEATGAIRLKLENTYGQWHLLRHNGSGVVRD
jgi:hypothetical protein